jgi:hypothetical protein
MQVEQGADDHNPRTQDFCDWIVPPSPPEEAVSESLKSRHSSDFVRYGVDNNFYRNAL